MRMNDLGAFKLVSVTASMIAAFVRFALAGTTRIEDALECFERHAEDLPLAHRDYASPPHWSGVCMAGALKRSVEGDLRMWPRGRAPPSPPLSALPARRTPQGTPAERRRPHTPPLEQCCSLAT